MNKQAWIDVSSAKHDKNIDLGLCYLNGALSSFTEFSRSDRSRVPTLEELQSDTEEDFEHHEHLEYDVYFGERPTTGAPKSNCWLTVEALKPSGYDIILTVPRYLLNCIRLPFVRQYDIRGDCSASTDEVETVLKALYTKHDKELEN